VTAPAGIELRAVAVKPQIASRIFSEDVDIVAQTIEAAPGFDLVIATDVLGYYTHGEQVLALTSISRMMAPGGILLCDGVAPLPKILMLEDLGSQHTSYTDVGNAGADLIVLRRR